MNSDRVSQARQLFERFPENDLARFSLAQALVDTDAIRDAIPHLRALCAKKSDWMVVHILLGKCLAAAGESDEARTTLQHALQLAIDQHHDGPRAEMEDLLRTL